MGTTRSLTLHTNFIFLVCLAFIFYHMLTFIRYIEVYFTFALVDFVKSTFCSIHFTIILAGLKKIVRYIEDFVIQRFVTSRFHCINRNIRQLIHQKRKHKKKKPGLPQPKKHVTDTRQTKACVHFFNPDKGTNTVRCQKPQLKLMPRRNKCQQPHTKHTLSKNTCRSNSST